jgi:transcriptional regulator
MYLPPQFRQTDSERIAGLIDEHGFGELVSVHEGRPCVNHLPFVLQSTADGGTRLLAHMARANPQWTSFDRNEEVLAVFRGPHGYVSPRWYSSPGVPTWNYAVVHVYGAVRLITDPDAALAALELLTARFEPVDGWSAAALDESRRASVLARIVAFEIPVARIEAKFKLSQNREAVERANVAAQLRLRASGMDAPLADLMDETLAAADSGS